ncbi:MAG: alkaline phosphatase family protein, partial [Phycisphaerae bacterium]
MRANRQHVVSWRRAGWTKPIVLLAVLLAASMVWVWRTRTPSFPVKCVVVGLDGLDPKLMKRFMDQGLLPNLKKLIEEGDFRPLATSNPPQSPVAWSCFATGMDPGGTAIFDFVHRDPADYAPMESMSTAKEPEPYRLFGIEFGPFVEVGDYRLPIRGGGPQLNRQGTPFWKYLEDADVPTTILRLPANYPPPEGKARQLAGMGTPDILGTEGSYYFWSDRKLTRSETSGSGTVSRIHFLDERAKAKLYGPDNALLRSKRAREKPMEIEFEITLDRANKSVRIDLMDQTAILRPGDWSDWLTVRFVGIKDYLPGNIDGMLRFHLGAIEPNVELYATAIQFDPASPAQPITNPPEYAKELADNVGRIYTLGMPEDNKAFSSRAKALSAEAFRQQCRQVLDDVWATTEYELDRYRGGLFFTYFRTTDVVSHMMWYMMDSEHVMHDEDAAKLHGTAIQQAYQWVDEKVGEIRARIGDDVLFIVMSDHGFAPFYREFRLSTWLLDNGWTTLYPWSEADTAHIMDDVNWEETRAYAVGLNGLYVNLEGRESRGAVPTEEYDAMVDELCKALEG